MNTISSRFPPFRRLLALLIVSGALQPHVPTLAAEHVATNSLPDSPSLLLAQNYSDKFDPARYLVSEKLDGVRAVWDGQQLRFRSGRVIHAPAWFTADFPSHPLDGELWMGRQSFERLSAAVRRQDPNDDEWKNISYQLYELPDGKGNFATRIHTLETTVAQLGVSWLKVLPQNRVADKLALKALLEKVVHGGGEGLMLHLFDAQWQTGRSEILLKLKPQLDAEAEVVAHEPGQGKYLGMLGALVVKTPNGQRFRLGTGLSDEQRRHPPELGATITYRYRDLTSTGLPKFASFLRIRDIE